MAQSIEYARKPKKKAKNRWSAHPLRFKLGNLVISSYDTSHDPP